MNRIERLKVADLVLLQLVMILQAAQHRRVNGVLNFAKSQRCAENDLIGRHAWHNKGLAWSPILGQRAGFVGAEHIHAGQFFDARQAANDSLLLRQPPSSPKAPWAWLQAWPPRSGSGRTATKLEQDPNNPRRIVTVRSVGYKLVV